MDVRFELTDDSFHIIEASHFDHSTQEFVSTAITLGISCIWNEFWTLFDNHNHSLYEEHAVFYPTMLYA